MQVVASSAVLMILFSSSSIALSLSFDGLLNVHYALVFGPLAFASSLVGVIVLGAPSLCATAPLLLSASLQMNSASMDGSDAAQCSVPAC